MSLLTAKFAAATVAEEEDEDLKFALELSLAEARVVIEDHRRHDNEERPHGGLGYRTPKQAFHEAQTCNIKMSNTVPAA